MGVVKGTFTSSRQKRAMRFAVLLASLGLVAACGAHTSLPPAHPVGGGRWTSNADGFVYTASFFTSEQESSEAWEQVRLGNSEMAKFCDSPQLVHRDVRWFEPVAKNEPRCAMIVYSFTCPARRPEWGSSLEYQRRQALLEFPASSIGAGCGEKDNSKIQDWQRASIPGPSGVLLSEWANCRVPPDMETGEFRLDKVNYVQVRTMVSPAFAGRERRPSHTDPSGYLARLAENGQRVHLVMSKNGVPRIPENIFVDQSLAIEGNGYCITLTAQQGSSFWRRTIKRDKFLPHDREATEPDGHSKSPDQYWQPLTDARLLQDQLAVHLGLELPEGRAQQD